MQKKYAIISMDVEDWYHTYFPDFDVDRSLSMLDGLDVALDIMSDNGIKGSFFVVGEIAKALSSKLVYMDHDGHDIACHSWFHFRPSSMSIDAFRSQLLESKCVLEAILGHTVYGYRAPSFGIDDEHYEIVQDLGFKYDSSMLRPQKSKKYGTLSLKAFQEVIPCVYRNNDFFEFEVSTQRFGDMNVLLGGGYIRMLPWTFMKWLTHQYIKTEKLYVLYIHPIDLSKKKIPHVKGISTDKYLRTHFGRGSVTSKFEQVIQMLKKANYTFTTFEGLRQELISQEGI